MRKLIYILLLLPLFAQAQYPDLMLASLQQSNSCVITTGNIFNVADATAQCGDEANSASLWSLYGASTSMTATVNSSDVTEGSYSIQFDHTGGTNDLQTMIITFTVESGESYTVTADTKQITGSSWEMWLRADSGWSSQQGTGVTGGAGDPWASTSVTSTTNSTTASVRFGGSSTSDGGDQMLIDNIRVVKN